MNWYKKAELFKNAYTEDEWDYKGHHIRIDMDISDPDVTKAFHFVTTPEGKEIFAPISPYDTTRETVEAWIDRGLPRRTNQRNNFDKNDPFWQVRENDMSFPNSGLVPEDF